MRLFSKRSFKHLALVILGALLFGQIALAAQACLLPAGMPAAAFNHDAVRIAHQTETVHSSVCLTHCIQADRLLQQWQFLDLQISAVQDLAPVLVRYPSLQFHSTRSPLLERNTSPPLSILYCSFQS
ncbi:MAG: hypothetical protein ACRERD_27370 [Candidatus Binatia bacterium]